MFIFYFLTTCFSSFQNSALGSTVPGLSREDIEFLTIPLPSFPEQKRIATTLNEQTSAVERARAAAEGQLEAAKALPAAYLRAVFSSAEAQQWPKKRIEDFAETRSGSTPERGQSDYYGGIIPWVKTGELLDGVIEDTEEHVTDLALKECSLKLLPVGALLIAMYGQGQTRGRTGLLAKPATTNQACFAIVPKEDACDKLFLQYWFRHNYGRLRRETEGRGGNQPNLNGIFLRKQEVHLPSLEVQRRVTALLSKQMATAEKTRKALEDQLVTIKKLPAALLRRAFSGEL